MGAAQDSGEGKLRYSVCCKLSGSALRFGLHELQQELQCVAITQSNSLAILTKLGIRRLRRVLFLNL